MARKQFPFYNRILFQLLLPVILIGIIISTLLVAIMSSPMKTFLSRQINADLQLASVMGLRTCEDSFNYLLELRLENNVEMNQVLQEEVLEEIKTISNQFPQIHLMVLESNKHVRICSLDDSPETWAGPALTGQDDAMAVFDIHGLSARTHVQYFPFWDWHIISFVFTRDYEKPIHMAYRVTYLSTIGVFAAVVGTLLIVFFLFIKKPLNRLVTATDGVADGTLSKINKIARNEFGRLMISFNDMIHSLEKEKAEVRDLLHQLRESEALFRSQFEFGNIGIAITTADRRWVRANKPLCQMLGFTEGEMYSKAWSDLAYPEDVEADKVKYNRMIAGEIENYEIDVRLFHKNGNVLYTHMTVSCFRNPDQSIKFAIFSILDITKRKLAEEERERMKAQLLQVQKMEAIGTLSGGIAHDFNNILSGIIGFAELSRMSVSDGDQLMGYLDNIMEAGNRAKDLVQQILTFSRQGDQDYKPLSIKVIVKEALKLIRASLPSTITIKQNIKSDSLVMGDPTQIHQIIMNLCTNAGHAMKENGGILEVNLIDICSESLPLAATPNLEPGPYLKLTVKDNGNGMPKEVLDRIFDPFFTTKKQGEGTGMGMAVVHGIVTNIGGAIHVHSEPGKGSCFDIFLPPIEAHVEPETKASAAFPPGNERILYVDDEPILLEVGQKVLERLGYEIVTRTSGIEALNFFRAEPNRFDLVITDLTMPKITGDKLAEALINIRPNIPVILCTGFSNKITEQKISAIGIKGLLKKPIILTELAQMVRQVLDDAKNTSD